MRCPQGGQPDAALQARIQTYRNNQQAAATELQGGRRPFAATRCSSFGR
jgi:hypothetical protein